MMDVAESAGIAGGQVGRDVFSAGLEARCYDRQEMPPAIGALASISGSGLTLYFSGGAFVAVADGEKSSSRVRIGWSGASRIFGM